MIPLAKQVLVAVSFAALGSCGRPPSGPAAVPTPPPLQARVPGFEGRLLVRTADTLYAIERRAETDLLEASELGHLPVREPSGTVVSPDGRHLLLWSVGGAPFVLELAGGTSWKLPEISDVSWDDDSQHVLGLGNGIERIGLNGSRKVLHTEGGTARYHDELGSGARRTVGTPLEDPARVGPREILFQRAVSFPTRLDGAAPFVSTDTTSVVDDRGAGQVRDLEGRWAVRTRGAGGVILLDRWSSRRPDEGRSVWISTWAPGWSPAAAIPMEAWDARGSGPSISPSGRWAFFLEREARPGPRLVWIDVGTGHVARKLLLSVEDGAFRTVGSVTQMDAAERYAAAGVHEAGSLTISLFDLTNGREIPLAKWNQSIPGLPSRRLGDLRLTVVGWVAPVLQVLTPAPQ